MINSSEDIAIKEPDASSMLASSITLPSVMVKPFLNNTSNPVNILVDNTTLKTIHNSII